jgi:rfaE bifunctional protein kinase chain/domain
MPTLSDIKKVRVLVAGDVMLDRYWWGDVTRISPEAPVPVVSLRKKSDAPGGAANVARNLAGLGARATLFGTVGTDRAGDELVEVLREVGLDHNHILRSDAAVTTVKTRVVAHGQHVVRVDHEGTDGLDRDAETLALSMVDELIAGTDLLLVSDYAKGFLTPNLLAALIGSAKSQGKRVVVDPKGTNFSKYSGVSVLTPNRKEAAEATGSDASNAAALETAVRGLMATYSIEKVLVTMSDEGMAIFEHGSETVRLAAEAIETYDVTGAGDTVIACLSAALAAGYAFQDAAKIANTAAALVVSQVGTSAITFDELADRLRATDAVTA